MAKAWNNSRVPLALLVRKAKDWRQWLIRDRPAGEKLGKRFGLNAPFTVCLGNRDARLYTGFEQPGSLFLYGRGG